MNISRPGRGVHSVLVVSLCAFFFVLAIGITLLSSNIYRSVVAAGDANYTQRTALSYLVNQVRQADHIDGVAVGRFGGSPALILFEGEYETTLYCYEGQLRELYTTVGSGLTAADGTEILELEAMDVDLDENGILTLRAGRADGSYDSAALSLRCGVVELGEVRV